MKSLNEVRVNIDNFEDILIDNLVIAVENHYSNTQVILLALREDLQNTLLRESELQVKLKNVEKQLTDKDNFSIIH